MATIDNIDLSKYGEKTQTLIKSLATLTNHSESKIKDSIMGFMDLCDHDTGFLCECRLKWIIKYIEENYKEI